MRRHRSIWDVSVTEQITPDTVRINILAQFIAVELFQKALKRIIGGKKNPVGVQRITDCSP